jgi:citrate synthase
MDPSDTSGTPKPGERTGDAPPGRAGRLSAAEAARRLGVQRDTLYAYVSRGLVRSESQPGTRARVYLAEDVELLRRRREGRRDPARVAREALHWGTPLLESALTRIEPDTLTYRGRDVTALAEETGFENVAGWLWGLPLEAGLPDASHALPTAWRRNAAALAALPPLERYQTVLAAAAAEDAGAYDTSPDAVRACGARMLRLLASVAVDTPPSNDPIALRLQHGWAPRRPRARGPLEAALILWADHELNVGTFTVRCVASARATPYAAAIAGLSALRGSLHGGVNEQVEALFDEVGEPARAAHVLEARLRRGERIPGFGHHLYPSADPRAVAIMTHTREIGVGARALRLSDAIAEAAHRLIGKAPNVDFATVTLRRAFSFPPGSALALVGIARCAGWVAHTLEQYAEPRLIRPRARYVGPE